MASIDELKNSRLEKLEAIRSLGVDPYPSSVRKDHVIKQIPNMDGQAVAIAGRILAVRGHGKLTFWDIGDESGRTQVVLKADVLNPDAYRLLLYMDIGDIVAVQGIVGKTEAGEVSVFSDNFQILAKTLLPLPDQWYGLKDTEERYRKRYLDTILNPVVKNRLQMRSKVIDAVRDFLTDRGYLEVETPTLQPVYGGGFARPFVTHHNELDADFYLRISDEMYLKRMIVGGFDGVFEITKVFRNEGVDRDHNPEFTMFEAQIAYQDYSFGMDIIEEIIEYTALRVIGKTTFAYQGIEMDVKRPWARMKMTDAIREFTGIDPLSWKSLQEAKAAIQKTEGIPEDKFRELNKFQSVGECIAFLFEEAVEEKLIQPTIIYDYPVENSPLAKKCQDARFTQRFEMFAYGSELGNNYTELNDPIELRKRFIEEKKREAAGFEEAHQTDYDYLTAIEHGFPPTCGIAIGIDRLVMMLTNAPNIKEVIPFPTLRPKGTSGKKSVKKDNSLLESINPKHIITRDQALELLHEHTKNENLRRHMYAVGYAMQALAGRLGGDPVIWEVMGLLHDADWEETKDQPDTHTRHTLEWLEKLGISEGPIVHALKSHNRKHTELAELEGLMEWALETVDELTGFIVAVALVRPDKSLQSVTVESVLKKWKNKEFARAVERNQIEQCEEKLGIPISEFIDITLKAMQAKHKELGL